MPQTRYGVSPWLRSFPRSRQPSYPRHRGPLDIDVAIVGGGLTGCATAYAFAAAGVKVALFEAERIGQASTARAGGVMASEPALDFEAIEKLHGRRAARHLWQAWRRAALDGAATLRRLRVQCRLEPRELLQLATAGLFAPDGSEKRLQREWQARHAAGVDGVIVKRAALARAVRTEASLAIRTKDSAVLDPYRACLGLAAAATKRGAQLFERSAVRRVKFGRRDATIETIGGTVKTRRVIIATGLPTPELFKPLRRHFTPMDTYFVMSEPVPAAIRHQMAPAGLVLRDRHVPPHTLHWVDEGRRFVFSGADQPSVPARQQERALVQRTGQLMYELSMIYPAISGLRPEYGWHATYGATVDGIPCIGPHRNFPHHLFALGATNQGLAAAFLASRILLREHLGEPTKADEVFGFARILG
jgi:glycine/D-amino acid oxidase-like deaminating enzyme